MPLDEKRENLRKALLIQIMWEELPAPGANRWTVEKSKTIIKHCQWALSKIETITPHEMEAALDGYKNTVMTGKQ